MADKSGLPTEALNAAWRRTKAGGADDDLGIWAMAGTSTSAGRAARRELLRSALEAATPAIHRALGAKTGQED